MFYNKSFEEILSNLGSNIKEGLTDSVVKNKMEQFGPNELKEKAKTPVWKMFLDNFKDPLVIVLLVAAVVQVALGEVIESAIIAVVLILNAILGVVQTKKAEGSLDALKQMSAPNAKVIRNGVKVTIPARELVPGDIVLLDAGDYVPADGRLIQAESLKIAESSLTGESEGVEKHTDKIPGIAPLGDQKNMAFSGSMVVYGRGLYVVTGTAMTTEMGKIAHLLNNAESKDTPLQEKLEEFGKRLGLGIVVLSAVIFGIEVARDLLNPHTATTGQIVADAFMFAIAIAVAAIPEALSSIVTIVLAVGTNMMASKNAIVRKLPAVETLGSTSVICSDKTGTLTQNKMTVVDTFTNDKGLLDKMFVLCNDSIVTEDGKEIGDPTEIALVKAVNFDVDQMRLMVPRLTELPFDSDRKMMSVVVNAAGKEFMFTKGAPDVLLDRCTYYVDETEAIVEMTERIKDSIVGLNEGYSNRAYRVLAFGYKPVDNSNVVLEDENELIFVGLAAMIDPPRPEVFKAVSDAYNAGIKTVMITGDHKTTASAIAKEIGIMQDGDLAFTGAELDGMSDNKLDSILEKISVFARVSPENKIRIVQAWQRKGKITAMTGDGVNDAPALKQADIGIGMGSGTDVAKDASAMVLTDDNFATIVSAVEVGRTVFDNIRKAIVYLFAGNLGAIIAILFAVFANWANPFTALQLLFINLVNDSLPAIALGLEKSDKDIMKKRPRDPKKSLFADGVLHIIITRGFIIGVAVIVAQYLGMRISPEVGTAMAFSTVILARTLQAFASRSNDKTIFELGFSSNKYVVGAVGVCLALYTITLLPFTRDIFSIPATFGSTQVLTCLGLAVLSTMAMEISKLVKAKKA